MHVTTVGVLVNLGKNQKQLHPRKLAWIPKVAILERRCILENIIFGYFWYLCLILGGTVIWNIVATVISLRKFEL